MHRIPASYLRGKSAAPDREFADVCRWLRQVRPRSRPMTLHLMKTTRDLARWLSEAGPSYSSAVEEAVLLGSEVVLYDLEDATAKEARFLGAQLLQALNATEPVVDRLREIYATADESTAISMTHLLHGMPYSHGAAQFYADLLKDPRSDVRWSAISHACLSARGDLLAMPLLEAFMGFGPDYDSADYEHVFQQSIHMLAPIAERLLDYLSQGAPAERRVALEVLGRLMRRYARELGDAEKACQLAPSDERAVTWRDYLREEVDR